MKLFIEIVVFALFSYTIIYYIRIRIFLSKLVNQNEKNADNVARKQIIIAIPVLREQKCICDTIKYFRKITKDIPIIKNTINIKYIYFLIITLSYILYMFFIVYKGFGHITYYEEIKH